MRPLIATSLYIFLFLFQICIIEICANIRLYSLFSQIFTCSGLGYITSGIECISYSPPSNVVSKNPYHCLRDRLKVLLSQKVERTSFCVFPWEPSFLSSPNLPFAFLSLLLFLSFSFYPSQGRTFV